MDAIKKIAVLRANALGDLIFVLPALRALKEKYPEAELVYLGLQWHADFLPKRVSSVDRVLVMPKYAGVTHQGKKNYTEFFVQARKEEFDIALQLHGGGRFCNTFIKQCHPKLSIGLCTPDADLLDVCIPYIYYQNEIIRYLEVVQAVGASTKNIEPKIHVLPEDIAAARSVLKETAKKSFVVIHPGASDMRKQWPPHKFALVADALIESGYTVVLTGIQTERSIINEVTAAMKQKPLSVCGKLSLGGLTGVCKLARLVIANDTGPLQVAKAIGTPTVGIFWCGNVITAGLLMRSKHRLAISWQVQCPLCGTIVAGPGYPFHPDPRDYYKPIPLPTTDCRHLTCFVEEVSVDEVLCYAEELLMQQFL